MAQPATGPFRILKTVSEDDPPHVSHMILDGQKQVVATMSGDLPLPTLKAEATAQLLCAGANYLTPLLEVAEQLGGYLDATKDLPKDLDKIFSALDAAENIINNGGDAKIKANALAQIKKAQSLIDGYTNSALDTFDKHNARRLAEIIHQANIDCP